MSSKSSKRMDSTNMSWLSYFRYIAVRVILWLTRDLRVPRFAKVHDLDSRDPRKYGALPSCQEINEEWPYTPQEMIQRKVDDVLTVFCTSSKGQVLTVCMQRFSNRTASVFLYLKTLKHKYSLRKELFVDLSAEDTFAVDGLRMECVLPMRRWRISFNGLLTNRDTGTDEHVRFVFTANLVSQLADFKCFHSERLLALQLSRSSSFRLLPLLLKPCSIIEHLSELDSLVQTMSFVGKVRIGQNVAEPYEEEVFAFGHKKRSHEKQSSAVECRGIFMVYTRNGISLYLEEVDVANVARSLVIGAFLFPSTEHCNIDFIQQAVMKHDDIEKSFKLGTNNLHLMPMVVEEELDHTSLTSCFNNEFRTRAFRLFKLSFDDREGFGVFIGAQGPRCSPDVPVVPEHFFWRDDASKSITAHVLGFEEKDCSKEPLTGGKASSLAILAALANKSQKFKVARGFAVTTVAYRRFSEQVQVSQAIAKLEQALENQVETDELQNICAELVDTVGRQSLPPDVRDDLQLKLGEVFGDIKDTKFAVRSSACGEDSEDMSAAGQMETFLGIKGVSNILSSVVKCWASQFSFVAVQYRRRYGQLINCPMAVCVQEMVNSTVSGVMFTVDPVTANPRFITITANFGLGESVVSASADPDTFVLEKIPGGARVVSSSIGSKTLRTVLLEEGGTKDLIDTHSGVSAACLTDEQVDQLAKAALEVENHYASQRDTEWAFGSDQQLFMLQARPVTSAHVVDSEFEYYHEGDEACSSEYDCLTKANVGEVLGGSVSQLTMETMFGKLSRREKRVIGKTFNLKDWQLAFRRNEVFAIQNSQVFFPTFTLREDSSSDSFLSKGFAIAMNGRVLDDDIIKIGAANRRRYIVNEPSQPLLLLAKELWQADRYVIKAENAAKNTNLSLDHCKNSNEMLLEILSAPDPLELTLDGHVKQINYGAINNVAVLALLSHTAGGWTPEVYSDFSKMAASCNNLISADVPHSLQKIARQANEDYGISFKELSENQALEKLQSDSTGAAELFRKFLIQHGHRSLHEFDLATKPWSMNPLPVVKTIQSLIGVVIPDNRADIGFDELLVNLQIKLPYLKTKLLQYCLRKVRKSIANRERTKNSVILCVHKFRLLYLQLGRQLQKEGRLPDPALVCFLFPYEILRLTETRCPKIVMRAVNRQKNSIRAAKDIYAEFCAGLPLVPINASSEKPVEADGSRRMTGTPVSQGTVIGPARVVLTIEDADQLQKGDVLITYATDIGWSPYFPLLGGIVTELGGLISHGAVVAREYGLPCIVAAHGATQLFKSGEKVLLNGTKGFVQTVDD